MANKTKKMGRRRKNEKKRRRKSIIIFLILLILIILGWGVWQGSKAEIFNIKKINISGNNHLSTEEILYLSGLKKGANIFRISSNAVLERLSIEPYINIKEAKVIKKYPDCLEIVIKEREPFAQIKAENKYYLINDEGYILEEITKRDLKYPLIENIETKGYIVGEKIRSEALKNCIEVLKKLDKEILNEIESVSAADIENFTLYTKKSVKILYGRAEEIETKNYLIKFLISEAESKGKKLIYIDVRVPSNPVTKEI